MDMDAELTSQATKRKSSTRPLADNNLEDSETDSPKMSTSKQPKLVNPVAELIDSIQKTNEQVNLFLSEKEKAGSLDPGFSLLLSLLMNQTATCALLLQQQNQAQPIQTHNPVKETSTASDDEKERRRSVVVSGLAESAGTPSNRSESDKKQITNLLDEIDVEGTIVSCYRLGQKKEGRHRLLKVVLATSSQQRSLIANARKLKASATFPRVFIRPSLTPEQQHKEFQLREELRALRKAGKKAHIVGGRPGDQMRKVEVLN